MLGTLTLYNGGFNITQGKYFNKVQGTSYIEKKSKVHNWDNPTTKIPTASIGRIQNTYKG